MGVKVGMRVGVLVGVRVGEGVCVAVGVGVEVRVGEAGTNRGKMQDCNKSSDTNTAKSIFFMERTIPGRRRGVK